MMIAPASNAAIQIFPLDKELGLTLGASRRGVVVIGCAFRNLRFLAGLRWRRGTNHLFKPVRHQNFAESMSTILESGLENDRSPPLVFQSGLRVEGARSTLRSLLLVGGALRVGSTQVGDRHRHLTRSLGHDRGPRDERVPSMEDEHIFILIGIPRIDWRQRSHIGTQPPHVMAGPSSSLHISLGYVTRLNQCVDASPG
jgi:hypothetical protein